MVKKEKNVERVMKVEVKNSKRRHLNKPGQPYTSSFKLEVVRAAKRLKSCKRAAEEYNISQHSVQAWVRAAGLSLKTGKVEKREVSE